MPALPGKISFAAKRSAAVTSTAKAAARRIRSSQDWRRVREMHLSAHPLCANPRGKHDGRIVAAAQVHHITRLELAPHLAFMEANLLSVCTECHAALSVEERQPESAN